MQDKLERLIKLVYKSYKASCPGPGGQEHLDEEAMVCFLEGRISSREEAAIKAHLVSCDTCAQNLAMQLKLNPGEDKPVPVGLIRQAKDLAGLRDQPSIMEIIAVFKEKAIQIINTTGDIVVGQELIPAPLLRSRNIQDFKDEVVILKDFGAIRVEAKLENKGPRVFSVTVIVKEKPTLRLIKDLRVTLLKNDLELESYLADSGRVIFENVLLGKYTIEISGIDNKLASILLDIKT